MVAKELNDNYAANDLRKSVFIEQNRPDRNFKGSYSGDFFSYGIFAGLATDEVYLNRGEALARTNRITEALKDLNALLSKRYRAGTFTPVVLTDADQVLRLVLSERRNERQYRGTRWTDLRRLNQDSRFAITLKRNIDGTEYTLPPNSPRYLFPIPDNEIGTSGIPQNHR